MLWHGGNKLQRLKSCPIPATDLVNARFPAVKESRYLHPSQQPTQTNQKTAFSNCRILADTLREVAL